MTPRYDTWPSTVECARCHAEYPAPTRADLYDGGAPSTLCPACEALEEFFDNLHNARWERAMQRLAGRAA